MPNSPMFKTGAVYPSLTYEEAHVAIEWLCRVFGFQERLVLPDEGGGVQHSELSFGEVVIMVSSPRPEVGRASPRSLGGVSQTLSLWVQDPDAHFAKAKSLGAEIVQEIASEPFGARGYMARDPEGHLWYFADYIPGSFWPEEA